MIERIAGTLLAPDDADYVFRALKLLSELLGKQGSRPTPRLAEVTAKLGKTVAQADVSGRKTDATARNQGPQADSSDDFGYALISSAEAANILGCSPGNVRDLRRRGVLPARSSGGRWLYKASDVVRRAER
jgi:hypothetical protein